MARRALVIGVAEASFADLPALPGVEVDVERVEAALIRRGFETRSLHTPAPARAAVQGALARLLGDTTSGDLGVVYFSGHGYRLLDGSGDENDDWDEALVCADGPIVDDWFRDTLWPQAQPGARFVIIVDACHSDTATLGLAVDDREVPPPATKPPPTDQLWRIVLAACRDEQKALDLGRGDDGGGVATGELLSILEQQPGISHRDLWTQVATNVRNLYAERGVGVPHLTSTGPDDSLLVASAFTSGLDDR